MGIKFRCEGCDKKLHVKAYLAGKRGVCPHCGAKVRIPNASEPREAREKVAPRAERPVSESAKTTNSASSPAATARTTSPASPAAKSAARQRKSSSAIAAASSDAISKAPEAVWYVRPPSGGQYGPADAEIMRRWLEEGRVSSDSLVWREGWEDWRTGDTVFPSLRATPDPEPEPAAEDLLEAAPHSDFALEEAAKEKPRDKKRAAPRASARGVAIVVALSVICVGLLIALLVVLSRQG